MYISCPSCSTSFNVSGSDIGATGQMVRCFNCGHSWHQYPSPPQVQAQYVPVQYVSPGQFTAAPREPNAVAPPSQYSASSQSSVSNPSTEQVSIPEPVTDPIPEPVPDPTPEPVPDPTPEPVEENLPSDQELDEMLGPEDTEAVDSILENTEPEEVESIGVDELEDLEDPEPIADIASEDANDEEVEEIDPEDIPDPEPFQAASFDAEPDAEEKKGSGIVKIIVWVLIVLLIIAGAGAGAIYKRDMVVNLLPPANIVFELLGLRVPIPGDGLRMKSDSPISEERDGKKVTVIKGVITNVSNSSQRVPEILLQAIDGKGVVVQTQRVKPEKLTLTPGNFVKFVGIFKKLPKTAKRLDIAYGPFLTGDHAGSAGKKAEKLVKKPLKKVTKPEPVNPEKGKK